MTDKIAQKINYDNKVTTENVRTGGKVYVKKTKFDQDYIGPFPVTDSDNTGNLKVQTPSKSVYLPVDHTKRALSLNSPLKDIITRIEKDSTIPLELQPQIPSEKPKLDTPKKVTSPKHATPATPKEMKSSKEDRIARNLVGRRIKVYWEKERSWFPGTVVKIINDEQADLGTHEIQYDDEDDGDLIIGNLVGPEREKIEILPLGKGISGKGGVESGSEESGEQEDPKDTNWRNRGMNNIDTFTQKIWKDAESRKKGKQEEAEKPRKLWRTVVESTQKRPYLRKGRTRVP